METHCTSAATIGLARRPGRRDRRLLIELAPMKVKMGARTAPFETALRACSKNEKLTAAAEAMLSIGWAGG